MATIKTSSIRDSIMSSSLRNKSNNNPSEHFLNIGLSYVKDDGTQGFMPIPGIVIALDKIQDLTSKNPELKDLALAIRLIQMNMEKLEPGETAIVNTQLTSKLEFQVRRINDEAQVSHLIKDEDEEFLKSLL